MLSHQTAIIGQSSLDPPLTGCRHCRPWLWLGSNCLPQTKPKNQIATVAPHLANSPNPPFQTDPQTKPKNQTQPQPPYQVKISDGKNLVLWCSRQRNWDSQLIVAVVVTGKGMRQWVSTLGSLGQEQRRGERDKTSMDTGSMVVTFGEWQQRARVAQPWPMVFVVREWVWECRCVGVFLWL